MATPEQKAKNSLGTLMSKVQPVIEAEISTWDGQTLDYILSNYRSYLKINLEADMEKARDNVLDDNPFDELMKDEL
jgi:hypothetical protein|tara:strand:+ start:3283 stop:3510 length:228 start_codon:yes stop_codon:yes gene_type:complete